MLIPACWPVFPDAAAATVEGEDLLQTEKPLRHRSGFFFPPPWTSLGLMDFSVRQN